MLGEKNKSKDNCLKSLEEVLKQMKKHFWRKIYKNSQKKKKKTSVRFRTQATPTCTHPCPPHLAALSAPSQQVALSLRAKGLQPSQWATAVHV